MIALALKNSILICLIVAIGYFIIDNHLMELRYDSVIPPKKQQPAPTKKQPIKNTVLKEIVEEEANACGDSLEEVVDTAQHLKHAPESNDTNNADGLPMKIFIDSNMKEIYSYVYGDAKAPDDLNSMYDITTNGDLEKDAQILCRNPEEEKFKRMCDDPIKEHHKSVDYEHIQTQPISSSSVYQFVDENV